MPFSSSSHLGYNQHPRSWSFDTDHFSGPGPVLLSGPWTAALQASAAFSDSTFPPRTLHRHLLNFLFLPFPVLANNKIAQPNWTPWLFSLDWFSYFLTSSFQLVTAPGNFYWSLCQLRPFNALHLCLNPLSFLHMLVTAAFFFPFFLTTNSVFHSTHLLICCAVIFLWWFPKGIEQASTCWHAFKCLNL